MCISGSAGIPAVSADDGPTQGVGRQGCERREPLELNSNTTLEADLVNFSSPQCIKIIQSFLLKTLNLNMSRINNNKKYLEDMFFYKRSVLFLKLQG